MKYVKTFENFEYLLEDAEVTDGGSVNSEESKEIIDATSAAVKAEFANKSAFSQKLKSKVAQAQAQTEAPAQEAPVKNEGYIFENVQGEMLTKENIQKYADALVNKLPILRAGDREVEFRGQKNVVIPAGAEYEAYKAQVNMGQLYVNYKDKNDRFPEVSITFIPSKDEIAHVAKIYSEFGKKLATQQKLSKFLTMGAKILAPLGVIAAIGGMASNIYHGSPSDPYREIPAIVIAGGAAIGAAGVAFAADSQISKKIDVAEDALSMFTALIKAFCDSLNMRMMEIQTVGDIQSLLTMDKIEVEVENTTTSAKVESVSNKLKGFDKF